MLRVTMVAIGAAALLLATIGTASAQDTDDQPTPPPADAGFVNVIEVSGLLDPVLANFVSGAIDDAEASGAKHLVLQVNSKGAVISDDALRELADRMATSTSPVSMWIGPSGSEARGGTAQLAAVANDVCISPNSRIGDLGESVLDEEVLSAHFGDALSRLRDRAFSDDEAVEAGIARLAPVLGDCLIDLDGFVTRVVDNESGQPRREPVTQTLFIGMSLLDQLFHTMASPPVAYLLFLIGMGLLVFEFYTAGVGIAGVVGAFCFIGGCYGLEVLPARGWAVALLVLSMLAFAIDIQTGVARVWTGIAIAALIVGSVALFDEFDFSWITLGAGIIGMILAMVSGMPAMVRTRFSTPTIGREWMIGEMGEAVGDVSPNGQVKVRDALWRARTNRATPIAAGDSVRVVAIEGLELEVEPEEGAARDYRDRS
ncbi:MAG: NfeD family protein [Acidimicrobiales bacterium]